MARLTAREALSYGMFGNAAMLQNALDGKANISLASRSLPEITRQLRDAIAKRTVSAEGYPEKVGQPAISTELLPWALFEEFESLAVDHTGETVFLPPGAPQNIPRWKNVTFDAKEILELWPIANQQIDAWMNADFANNPLKKRKDRISDCTRAIPCTFATATAAFNRSPSKKRSRGQRATNRP
ncbi:hypothetical protein GGD65_003222 [Bradyrhizobium sp. CIR18]|uniref:hypothetical protein n=1 Tax=Bradyrhizobium sp. CIR18 TaxID=2663839 RepID=UPI001605DC36|nr:hypothetical protein [Bradyrhizobium sp. CIR18]MBB4362197.1 hypothetical protein [Bradyrhizobium sp. CIR18]